jgi:hypothetical protein
MSSKSSNKPETPGKERMGRVVASGWGMSRDGKVSVTPPHDATLKPARKRRKAG